MNFQDFCLKVEHVDGSSSQHVQIDELGEVIRFVQQKSNKEFLISAKDILALMKYIRDHIEKVKSVILAEERFGKEQFTQYEEKGYRALFSYIKDVQGLRPVSSLGGSQSLGVTQVVAKVICFLSTKDYVGVKNNTYIDKASIDEALNNIGPDISQLLKSTKNSTNNQNLMSKFVEWLQNNSKEWSESTIKKYSNDSISKADEILTSIKAETIRIYTVDDPKIINQYILELEANEEWNQRNTTGNRMFSRGLDLYKEFLESNNIRVLINSNASLLAKPFLLLAGISGTGKTRFVRNQSEHNCLVTPVRPDWHEPSDILGYVSRLNKAEKNTYVVTDVLCFILRAWKAAFDSGVVFENEYVAGEKGQLDAIAPFWLCLDEMNLAPVEQYFADYLSVLESRRWCWEDDSFNYCSLPLLSSGVISAVDKQSLRADLQLEQSSYDDLWNYFCENGITLPFNLIVAGTVNMDETTHGFSRKVIDRAITLDFGEFYPNGFDTFFDPTVEPKHFTYPRLSNIDNKDQLKDVAADADGSKTIAFLTAINVVLSDTPFELAYRALNELLLSVVCSNPTDNAELHAVWDDFLMTKVLPRIEGDADKLQKLKDGKPLAVLPELLNVIKNQLGDLGELRKDYFLEKTAVDDKAHFIPYRSPKKIEWMQARLNSATFTSFWP